MSKRKQNASPTPSLQVKPKGGACQNPAIKGRSRCKLHGGKSTGPRTSEGRARVTVANTKHGRRSKAHVEKIKFINAQLRRITYELKRGGWINAL